MLDGLVVRGQPNKHGKETFRAVSKDASCESVSPYYAHDNEDDYHDNIEDDLHYFPRRYYYESTEDTNRRRNITRDNFARARSRSVRQAPPPPRRAYIVEYTHDNCIGKFSDMWNDEDGKSISCNYPDEQKEREEWEWHDAGHCVGEESRPRVYDSWASAKRAALTVFITECYDGYWHRDEVAMEDMKRRVPYDIEWEYD